MIDIAEFEQFWFVIMFEFGDDIHNCDYKVSKQLIKSGKLEVIEEKIFQDLNDLINYLSNYPINPDYIRAIH